MTDYNAIAECNHFIALDKYSRKLKVSESLPREITLRQKQYEYYRDLLLTLPKTPSNSPLSGGEPRFSPEYLDFPLNKQRLRR